MHGADVGRFLRFVEGDLVQASVLACCGVKWLNKEEP